jgi:tetratricopeptide (TPR) repeat protein
VNRHTARTDLGVLTDEPEESGADRPPSPPGEPAFRDRLVATLPSLSPYDGNSIRSLAASLHELGLIQFERETKDCITSFEESFELSEQIGDRAGAAICASNLCNSYMYLQSIRDLDKAEKWCRRSLGFIDERDRLLRGRSQNQLGAVALRRFEEARDAGELEATSLARLNEALKAYHEALELIPEDAVGDLAVSHNELGHIYQLLGDIERALTHFREAIRYHESGGDNYGAAQARYNLALAMAQSKRFQNAREYALAARDGFAPFGPAAAEKVQKAQRFIDWIDDVIAGEKG